MPRIRSFLLALALGAAGRVHAEDAAPPPAKETTGTTPADGVSEDRFGGPPADAAYLGSLAHTAGGSCSFAVGTLQLPC